MWLSSEDARGDYILAVAAVVLGNRLVVNVLAPIPFYPVSGTAGLIVSIAWIALLAGATPLLLARWRRQVPGAFGLEGPIGRDLVVGAVAAAPLLIAHVIPFALDGDLSSMGRALLGRFAVGSPGIGVDIGVTDRVYYLVGVTLIGLGSWLWASFLVVRSRDAFRSPDMDLTQSVRTFGMGGVGATVVFGVLNMAREYSLGNTLRVSLALLAVVLVTDQYVPARRTTTRATLVAPAIASGVLYVLAAGGLFRGDLLLGLYTGAAAAVVMLCAAALIEARRGAAAAVLLIVSAVYAIPLLPQPIPNVFLSV